MNRPTQLRRTNPAAAPEEEWVPSKLSLMYPLVEISTQSIGWPWELDWMVIEWNEDEKQ